jgi:hypothetical protein
MLVQIVLAMWWVYFALGSALIVHHVGGYMGAKMGVANSACDDGEVLCSLPLFWVKGTSSDSTRS